MQAGSLTAFDGRLRTSPYKVNLCAFSLRGFWRNLHKCTEVLSYFQKNNLSKLHALESVGCELINLDLSVYICVRETFIMKWRF